MRSTPAVSTAASQLKHAAPKEWDEFVRHFLTLTDELTVAVTNATENVQVEQGKARLAHHLLRVFLECDTKAKH